MYKLVRRIKLVLSAASLTYFLFLRVFLIVIFLKLKASKDAEAASSSKKPNWIYARNVLRILKSDFLAKKVSH